MNTKILIRDLPDGSVIWYNDDIIGIKGGNLHEDYLDHYVVKIFGNEFDYQLVD